MRLVVSGPLGVRSVFLRPRPSFPHTRTRRYAKAVMTVRCQPTPFLRPRVSQHKFQSHTQQMENSIIGLLLFSRFVRRSFASWGMHIHSLAFSSPYWRRFLSTPGRVRKAPPPPLPRFSIQLNFNISRKYLKISNCWEARWNWLPLVSRQRCHHYEHQKNLIKRIFGGEMRGFISSHLRLDSFSSPFLPHQMKQ